MINISPMHIFDASILLSISKEIVNLLWQIIYKSIEICKFILNVIIELY